MGYTIEYNKIFLRSEQGYTVCWLSGPNNCTDFVNNRERRTRDWEVFENFLGVSEKYISEYTKKWLEYDCEMWYKAGKFLHVQDALRWLKNGVRSACTIEEFLGYNALDFVSAYFLTYENCEHKRSNMTYISTTEDLDNFICGFRKVEKASSTKLYPVIDFPRENVKQYRKPNKINEYTFGVILQSKNVQRTYLIEKDGRFSFTRNIKEATVFDLEKALVLKTGRLRDYTFVDAENARKYPYNCVIMYEPNKAYFEYSTRSRVHLEHDIDRARRFKNRKEAEKQVEKLNANKRIYGFIVVELD